MSFYDGLSVLNSSLDFIPTSEENIAIIHAIVHIPQIICEL